MGPGAGVEGKVSFTIGDLRRARQSGDWLLFYGGPSMMIAWFASFSLLIWAFMVVTQEFVFAAAYIVLVPLLGIAIFMPFAAVWTDLE